MKKISLFKKSQPEPLDPDMNSFLRDLAGWPLQQHHQAHGRHMHRTTVVYRDAFGRITNSIEQIDEDGYEEYSDNWGK